MAQEGKPWDRMAFCYAQDAEADRGSVLCTAMRPGIPIRIANVRSARRGGSDRGYGGMALADSGADATFITRGGRLDRHRP